jgi:hypothetical protein
LKKKGAAARVQNKSPESVGKNVAKLPVSPPPFLYNETKTTKQ